MRKIVFAIILVVVIIATYFISYRVTMHNISVTTTKDNTVAWCTVYGERYAYQIEK